MKRKTYKWIVTTNNYWHLVLKGHSFISVPPCRNDVYPTGKTF